MRKNKRLLSVFLAIAIACATTFLVGCGEEQPPVGPGEDEVPTCEHVWSSRGVCLTCGEACEHDYSVVNEKTHDHICAICKNRSLHEYKETEEGYTCEICGESTAFEVATLNGKYLEKTDKNGTVVTVEYDTYAYALAKYVSKQTGKEVSAQDIPVRKSAYVYLPYGYSNSECYNVLYLLHGNGESAGYWFGVGDYAELTYNKDTLPLLDNMMSSGEAEQTIVVTPGLFTYADEGSEYAEYNEAMYDAADETDLTLFYHLELKDLIRVVESTYPTYANGDVSDAGLIASRAHRGYAGLSRGSRTAFGSIIYNSLEYFGYVGNFSLAPNATTTNAMLADEVNASNENGYPIYYWYMACGTSDSLYDDHYAAAMEIYELCNKNGSLRMGEDYENGENFRWIKHPAKGHSYEAWICDLANCMKVFFK